MAATPLIPSLPLGNTTIPALGFGTGTTWYKGAHGEDALPVMARSTPSRTYRLSSALLGAPRHAGGYKHSAKMGVDFQDELPARSSSE